MNRKTRQLARILAGPACMIASAAALADTPEPAVASQPAGGTRVELPIIRCGGNVAVLLELIDDVDPADAWRLVTYTAIVTNQSNIPHREIELSAEWPSDAECLDAQGAAKGMELTENRLVFATIRELSPGAKHSVQFTLQFTTPGEKRVNCRMGYLGLAGPPILETERTDVGSLPADGCTLGRTSLTKLDVFDTPDPVTIGQSVTYTVQVADTEPQEDVRILCVLPAGAKVISSHSSAGPAQIRHRLVRFPPIASLPARKTERLELVVQFNRPCDHRLRFEVRCKNSGTRPHVIETEATRALGDDRPREMQPVPR